jgi:hypothetical protein
MKTRWAAIAMLVGCPIALMSDVQVKLHTVKTETVKERLQAYGGNDAQRERTLKSLFESAGCTGAQLSEQAVEGLKEPNLLCVLPGASDSVIIIGAHYDHVDAGEGVVDNWSGASMLPSLYEALNTGQRRHTLVFAAFAGEEKGLVGSKYYVKKENPEQLKKIRAMICMDTLGLGPTEVWVSRSDKKLVAAFATLANAMKLPASRVDVDGVGISDEESFRKKKIPTITIHSLTPSTLGILHTAKDNYGVVKLDDYYVSFRLLSWYLSYLDQTLDAGATLP